MSLATNIQQKLCLAVVSSKEYWTGTKVAVRSFLKSNPWFDGDIRVVISDKQLQNKVQSLEGAGILLSDSELDNKIDRLCDNLPEMRLLRDRLLVLNIFKLTEYSRVIYIDSDMLFQGSLESEILKADFMAAPDPWLVRGYFRDRNNYKKIQATCADRDECYTFFFNSGLLSVSDKFLNKETYEELLVLISPEFFKNVKDDIADEAVLNYFFESKATALPVEMNCSVHLIMEKRINNIPSVIHFTGKNKPWILSSWFRLAFRNLHYILFLYRWLSSR